MIVPPKSKQEQAAADAANVGQLVDVSDIPGPSTLVDAPPPFEEVPPLIDSGQTIPPPGNDQPPPEFAPYVAEFFETSSGDIVSHDKHLNSDGEALYRFLLSHAAKPPNYRLHCRGHHKETRYRTVSHSTSNGRTESRGETYIETVVDFDFAIDIGHVVTSAPIHWSVADSEPTYRGGVVREVDTPAGARPATRDDIAEFKDWVKARTARGLAPWVGVPARGWRERDADPREETRGLKSSKSVRQWADDYCASRKLLKEFVFEKVVYGWETERIKDAVRSTIMGTYYQGVLDVDLKTTGNKIYVRPDNELSRMLSNKWLKFMLWILLIYPFVWLFKRFHPSGGGRWEVCGGAYALKRWEPMAEPSAAESAVEHVGRDSSAFNGFHSGPRVIRTETGVKQLVGVKEGEWFKQWQGTIARAVCNRHKSSTPIYQPDDGGPEAARLLDGYNA